MNESRNKLQTRSMSAIYTALTYIKMGSDFDIKEIIANELETPFEECDIFIKQVVVAAILHREDIIKAFEPNLRNWDFDRLSRVVQSILFLSYAHYYYVKDVDKGVVIDVAVKLAKDYAEKDDYKFVNGILDNTLK